MPPGGHVLVGGADRGDHLVDADAQRCQRVGLDLDQDLARHAAVDVDARHAGHVLERLDDRLVGERRELAQRRRRREHRERHDRLLRSRCRRGCTSGSLTSRGKPGRTSAILSRTSCIARVMSVDRRNSMNIWLWPSREFERISLTPETVLTASSIGLVTSVSTASGAAPGYGVWMRDERQGDVGHLLDAQPVVREEAEHRDADHHHRGEDRVVDGDAGDPHGGRLLGRRRQPAACVGRTSAPTPAPMRRRATGALTTPARRPSGCRSARPAPALPPAAPS